MIFQDLQVYNSTRQEETKEKQNLIWIIIINASINIIHYKGHIHDVVIHDGHIVAINKAGKAANS